MIELGVETSRSLMLRHDKIWSKYSHDKIDIGETMSKVLRTLAKTLPLKKPLRAISIGSSNEPQYRILEANFRGGLYLLDIEKAALDQVKRRVSEQDATHVFTLQKDYTKIFFDSQKTSFFLKKDLRGKKLDFITLQHSMYYCGASDWPALIGNLYSKILMPTGAIYSVLMSPRTKDRSTTTWLYNHFAGKFFGVHNNQDLLRLKGKLKREKLFQKAQFQSRTHRIRFFVDDFGELMSVVWMILLYPNVHPYTVDQRREITEYVYKNFFLPQKPLFQDQDHLVIYRGLKIQGLV